MSDSRGAGSTDIAALGSILGVWAHPDDECYLMAGLSVLARSAGNEVSCITATRGELGTPDPDTWPPDRLARLRVWELRAALAVLGIEQHHWLGYPDGGCTSIPAEQAIKEIGRLIEQIAPDTIVTFGPDGMTGHKDHLCICEWTTEARRRVAPGARLLYATATPESMDAFGEALDGFNIWEPGYPITTEREDLALRLEVEGELLDQKLAALRAQASQTAIFVQAVGEQAYQQLLREEAFVDADEKAR